VARQVCSARVVVFDEAHGWDWTTTVGAPSVAEFTVEYIYADESGAGVAVRPASPRAPSSPTRSAAPSARTLASPRLTPVTTSSPQSAAGLAGATATPPKFVIPLEDDDERLDAAHGESPMRYRTYDNIIGTGEPVSGFARRIGGVQSH
jgi:hypothetical protein